MTHLHLVKTEGVDLYDAFLAHRQEPTALSPFGSRRVAPSRRYRASIACAARCTTVAIYAVCALYALKLAVIG